MRSLCLCSLRSFAFPCQFRLDAFARLVPEDRKKNGLILGMDVLSNISITTIKDLESFGFIQKNKEKMLAEKYNPEKKNE